MAFPLSAMDRTYNQLVMGPPSEVVEQLMPPRMRPTKGVEPLDDLLGAYGQELPALRRIEHTVTERTRQMIASTMGRYSLIFTAAQECAQVYPQYAPHWREIVARHLPTARSLINDQYLNRVRNHVAAAPQVSIPLWRLLLDVEHPDYAPDPHLALAPRRMPMPLARSSAPLTGSGGPYRRWYSEELVPETRAALHRHLSALPLRGRWPVPGPRNHSMAPIAETQLWTKWSTGDVPEELLVARAARLLGSLKTVDHHTRRRLPHEVAEAEEDARAVMRTPAGRAYRRSRWFPRVRRLGHALQNAGTPHAR